jgi:hypothetical protein
LPAVFGRVGAPRAMSDPQRIPSRSQACTILLASRLAADSLRLRGEVRSAFAASGGFTRMGHGVFRAGESLWSRAATGRLRLPGVRTGSSCTFEWATRTMRAQRLTIPIGNRCAIRRSRSSNRFSSGLPAVLRGFKRDAGLGVADNHGLASVGRVLEGKTRLIGARGIVLKQVRVNDSVCAGAGSAFTRQPMPISGVATAGAARELRPATSCWMHRSPTGQPESNPC